MNSAEADVKISLLSATNLVGIAFPSTKFETTPINIFRATTYSINLEPNRDENLYKIDIKQPLPNLEDRINQFKITSTLQERFIDPEYNQKLDATFQSHLRASLLSAGPDEEQHQARAIDAIKAYRHFLTIHDYYKFSNLHPLFKKWDVLQEYLLSMGVKLINQDGSIECREIKTPEAQPQREIVTETGIVLKKQETPFKPPSFLDRLKNYFRNIRNKNN